MLYVDLSEYIKLNKKKCLNERKSGLEVQQNVWMVEKDKVNWRESENLRC